MELYFLRHGIAESQPLDGWASADRRLTDEGARKMREAVRGMHQIGIAPNVILSSPLARARQTAEIVGVELGLVPQFSDTLAPGMTIDQLAALLAEHGHLARIMLVGHEPDLSDTISALTGGSKISMKKGALASVELPSDDTLDGTLLWLLPPRVLRALAAR